MIENYETLVYNNTTRFEAYNIYVGRWSSVSEASGASLRNILDELKNNKLLNLIILEPPHSNQCTESDFFRLETIGPHLEPPQCFSEEQSDCLSHPSMTYFFVHIPFGHSPTPLYVSLTPLFLARRYIDV